MAADARKIKETYARLDEESFEMAVRTIRRARTRYIVGVGKCSPLSSYLAAQLHLVYDQVRLLTLDSARGLIEQLLYVGEKDVVIAIDFPDYSMGTVKAVEFASGRKAKIITVTDDALAPVNLYASCKLTAVCDRTAIGDSLVAPMSLLNMLVASVSMNRRKRVVSNLESLETIYEDYHLNLPPKEGEEEIQVWGLYQDEIKRQLTSMEGEKHE